jgi:hypothetical protein
MVIGHLACTINPIYQWEQQFNIKLQTKRCEIHEIIIKMKAN